MKKMAKILMIALGAALAFTACSSMDPDASKGGDFPGDFDVAIYAVINADVVNAQLRDSVNALNTAKSCKVSVTDTADMKIFKSDSAALKTLYTEYLGTDEIHWPGYTDLTEDAVYADVFAQIVSYYHVCGNTANEDVLYLSSVKIDSSVVAYQYPLAGKAEGRAYRYCNEGELLTVQDASQAEFTGKVYDYSAHSYCYDENSATKYLID